MPKRTIRLTRRGFMAAIGAALSVRGAASFCAQWFWSPYSDVGL